MNKLEYLILSFNHRAYANKAFLISILSVINQEDETKLDSVPYALKRDYTTQEVYFVHPSTNDKIVISDGIIDQPLFFKKEPVVIPPDKSIHVPEGVTSTFGRFLVNVVVFKEALGNDFSFIDEQIDGKKITSIIRQRMVDTPKDGEVLPDGKSTIKSCLKITNQLNYLEGLSPIVVKASSTDVFTINPEIIKKRDELLQELEEKELLDDPVSVIGMIDQLVAMDLEDQLNGVSSDLYIKKAFVSNSRKKMFLLFDYLPDFHTGKYQLLHKSLKEGWDLNQFTSYVNTAIEGSYSRSKSVANAGADIKDIINLTNNIQLIQGDCRTQRYEKVKLTKNNVYHWIGGYYQDGERLNVITAENVNGLVDKTVNMRVPQYCTESKGNLCSTCLGAKIGKVGTSISNEVSLIFVSIFLLNMKKIHVSEASSIIVDLDTLIK